MFKRLMQPTGLVATTDPMNGDAVDVVRRPCILVHSGPNGAAAVLESADGPLIFDVIRIQEIVRANNAHVAQLRAEYGGIEKTPIGAYPPILDIHVDESMENLCGRLATDFWFEIRDVPKVGPAVACVMGYITFLGQSAVDAVRLGKFYHLSVGIDDNPDSPTYNLLGETSVVLEPAAAGAMILTKKKGPDMGKKQTAPAKKTLSAKQKALKAIGAEMKTLTTGLAQAKSNLVAIKEKTRLTQRQGIIRSSLSRLMADKKLAPAEAKTLTEKHMARLTAMSDEDRTAVFEMLALRENIIEPGQRGSTGAVPFTELGENLESTQKKAMRLRIRESMIKKGAKLSKAAMDELEFGKASATGAVAQPAAETAASRVNPKRRRLSADTAESDKKEKELEAAEEAPEAPAASDELQEQTEDVQAQIDELNTQVARMASLIEQIVDNDEDEIADEHEDGEPSELEAKDDEDKKDLSEEKPDEDDSEAKDKKKLSSEKDEDDKKDEEKK